MSGRAVRDNEIMDDISTGKASVESILRDECAKRGVTLDLVEWGQSGEDFAQDHYSMAYTIGGVRRVERFNRPDLMDTGVRKGRERLRRRIADLISGAVPPKKIGF